MSFSLQPFSPTDEQVFVKLPTKVTNYENLENYFINNSNHSWSRDEFDPQNRIPTNKATIWFSQSSSDDWIEMVRLETNNCQLRNLNKLSFHSFSSLCFLFLFLPKCFHQFLEVSFKTTVIDCEKYNTLNPKYVNHFVTNILS